MSNKRPLISIVVPVYNAENYINRCIDSILAQRYYNIEILLIDDGSPDGCPQICDHYSELDNRVKVVHKDNGGLSDARNQGIKISKGEYIAFVDSDDYISIEFINNLFKAIEENQADISVCSYRKIYDDGRTLYKNKTNKKIEFTNTEAIKDIISTNSYTEIMTWNKIYKTSLFKENNINFPVGKIHEDNYTTYKLYYYANKVVFFDEPLYYYTQRDDSIMGRKFDYRRLDSLGAVLELADFNISKKLGLNDEIMTYNLTTNFNLINSYIDTRANDKQIWKTLRDNIILHKKQVTNIGIKNTILSNLVIYCRLSYVLVRRIYKRFKVQNYAKMANSSEPYSCDDYVDSAIVEIVSMQRISNYGSFLQAYALKKIVELNGAIVKFTDFKVETPINKKNEIAIAVIVYGSIKKFIINVFNWRKLFYKIKVIKSTKIFKTLYSGWIYKYLGVKHQVKIGFHNPRLIIIGSDEVFNCLQATPGVGYSLELFGKGIDSKINLVSYAASFGNTTLARLKKYNVNEDIGLLLTEFNNLSVRDENSKLIVESLTGKSPLVHIDPVFVYDFKKELQDKTIPERYLIIYTYIGRLSKNEIKLIKKFARKNKLRIVCLGVFQSFADENIMASPFEVLSYIKHAEYVITDTFHGTIFAIKYSINFVTLVRKSTNNEYGNQEKITSLVSLLNLSSRMTFNAVEIEKILSLPIDYKKTNDILNKEIRRTNNYIRSVMEGSL